MRLYHHPYSDNARRAVMAALHLDAPIELVLVDLQKREQRQPHFRARADVNRWLFWCGQHLTPAVGILNMEHFIKGMIGLGGPDPAEVKRGEDGTRVRRGPRCAPRRPRMDVRRRAHARGSRPRHPVHGFAGSAAPEKLPIGPFSHVQRWLARVQALDAWKKTAVVAANPGAS